LTHIKIRLNIDTSKNEGHMKNLILGIVSTFCFGSIGYASTTYVTSTGAVFTQVQGPGSFGLAWQDPSGMIWSTNQGNYGNWAITPDQNGVAVDSPATVVCARLGGTLPIAKDYKKLASYFESRSPGLFTTQGQKDFDALFPDQQSRTYWTASIVDADTANVFYYGHLVNDGRTGWSSVRCVNGQGLGHATQITFTTSKGSTFTEIRGPGEFENAWKDPSGAIWSLHIGSYSNKAIQPDQNGTVVDSPATEACAKLGGRLPSVKDSEKLLSYFDLDGNRNLTYQGSLDLQAVFPPGVTNGYLWTSSVDASRPGGAYIFSFITGRGIDYDENRGFALSIQCISP
jgi:hypothetical protein